MNNHSESPSDAAALLELGEEVFEEGEYTLALEHFRRAWEALPAPREDAPLAVQILVAVADAQFQLTQWEPCHETLQHALRCGLPVDHPFGRLRLGQSLYELGNEREAANWLVPVYLMHGRKPFEDEDPKYLEFFRSQLRLPEGGWPEGW